VALHWRDARDQLAGAGADAATLAAVQANMPERTYPPPGYAVLARGGAVRFSEALPQRPWREISRWAPLPHVMPLLAQRLPRLPHVRVGADRTGGRVLAFSADGTAEEMNVRGESWPVHKVSAGGWSEPRFQRSAEETWAENAKRIADTTALAAEQVGAEFVVLGGDVRERTMVAHQLPKALSEATVMVDREVAPDSAAFTAAAQAEIARRVTEASRAKLDEFRARMSVPDVNARRAVEGLDLTLTALRDGLASDVLIAYDVVSGTLTADDVGSDIPTADDPSPVEVAWIGPRLADAATEKEQLLLRGIPDPVRDRADAALARAICGTDAELFFLPEDAEPPAGGIGAVLRAPVSAAPA
jgi:hypothetical protein